MRTLWILFITMIAYGNLEAQLSGTDSSFLLHYSKDGISGIVNKGIPQGTNPGLYYLVKFQKPVTTKTSSLQIIRQLTNQHAIIRIDAIEKNSIIDNIEYIYPANDAWKLPPGVSMDMLKKNSKRLVVVPVDQAVFRSEIIQLKGFIIETHSSTNSILVEVPRPEVAIKILQSPAVIFLQPISGPPKEELLINGFDLSTNRVNMAHAQYPSLNGLGVVASVKENKFDTTDIDFKGRYVPTGLSSNIVTGHASIMATMVGGGGNSYHLGKGVAWNAELGSTNFAQLFPAPTSFYNQFHITVENHSYGTAIENFYGADAAAYDASITNKPSLVHVFSSGNSGTSASTAGNYSGISNFANLTGSFKMAKNIISVGATDSFANVEPLSSRGPAFDGRVKPDLVAFGQDGSSGAAALVSGTCLLIQQAYKLQHQDSLPTAALVKAALVNTADEVGTTGPDYISGFGSLNSANALRTIVEGKYFQNSITDNVTETFPITIPAGIQQFKITMAYSDPPAQPNAFKALVNDLDLELVEVSTGQNWRPWILNSAPNKDSLALPAIRNRDSVNNVEQISVENPAPGSYHIKVFGGVVTNGSQAYSLVYNMAVANSFQWDFPLQHDPVFAGEIQTARWSSSYSGNGKMEFSADGGTTWQLVAANVDLSRRYFKWQVPDTFHLGILKMTINGNEYSSDTFVISRNIQMNVGFNCADSVLLTWNKINKADQYRVYALTSNFLQQIAIRSDTFFIFSKADINAQHFTVAPLQQASEGIKAYTINYATQGVGCYFKEFLVQLNNDRAIISLELGSLFNVKQIEIQKENGADFLTFQTVSLPTQLVYVFENLNLHPGVNRFRVKLTLNDGRVIFSSQEVVYYLANQEFIFYPNPASVAQGFTVLRKELEDVTLLLYDVYGKKVKQILLQDLINPVVTASLQRGLYFAVVIDKNGKRGVTQKIVLQ